MLVAIVGVQLTDGQKVGAYKLVIGPKSRVGGQPEFLAVEDDNNIGLRLV